MEQVKRHRGNDGLPTIVSSAATSSHLPTGYGTDAFDDGDYDESEHLPTGYGAADSLSSGISGGAGSFRGAGGVVKAEPTDPGRTTTTNGNAAAGPAIAPGSRLRDGEDVRLGVKRERERDDDAYSSSLQRGSGAQAASSAAAGGAGAGAGALPSSFLPAKAEPGAKAERDGLAPWAAGATQATERKAVMRDPRAPAPLVPVCEECGTNKFVIEHAHNAVMVCSKCGMQVGGTILTSEAEWRNFGDAESAEANRVGGPHDDFFGLGTSFGGGKEATPQQRQRYAGYNEMKKIVTTTLQLPSSVLDVAKIIFMEVQMAPVEVRQKHTLRTDALAAASVWTACKIVRQPRGVDEIVVASGVPKKLFNKHVKAAQLVLASEAVRDRLRKAQLGIQPAESEALGFVDRYCNELGYPLVLANAVKALLQKAILTKDTPNTRSPGGQAAAAIYLCAHLKGLNPSLEAVAARAMLSEDTVLKAALFYYERRMALVPEGLVDRARLESLPPPGR